MGILILRSSASQGGGGGGEGFTPETGFALDSGTFADGQDYSIGKSGGGFGTKPNGEKPLFYLPGQSNANFSALSRTTGSVTLSSAGSIDSTTKPTNYAGAIRYNHVGSTETIIPAGLSFGEPAKAYSWFMRRYSFLESLLIADAQQSNAMTMKTWRFWPDDFSNNDIYVSQSAASGDLISCENQNVSPVTHYLIDSFVPDQWYYDEHLYELGTLNTQDGLLHFIRNGVMQNEHPEYRWMYRDTANSAAPTRLFFDEIPNQSTNPAFDDTARYTWYADILADDSWCQGWVTNNASWSASTVREPQIVTGWTDTAVALHGRRGELSALSGGHLHLRNNAGTMFYAGVGA